MLSSKDRLSNAFNSSGKDDRTYQEESEGKEKSVEDCSSEKPLVPYEILRYQNPVANSIPNPDLYKVLFTLPTNEYVDIDQLVEKPILARGCYFTLEKGTGKGDKRESGKVTCIFESAFPEETATAIAMKVATRIRNPTPDGVGDVCIIA